MRCLVIALTNQFKLFQYSLDLTHIRLTSAPSLTNQAVWYTAVFVASSFSRRLTTYCELSQALSEFCSRAANAITAGPSGLWCKSPYRSESCHHPRWPFWYYRPLGLFLSISISFLLISGKTFLLSNLAIYPFKGSTWGLVLLDGIDGFLIDFNSDLIGKGLTGTMWNRKGHR